MEQCILTVGTVTRAIRARKLLAAQGISARLIKSVKRGNAGGCAYGIEVSPPDMQAATEILDAYHITYEWSRGTR